MSKDLETMLNEVAEDAIDETQTEEVMEEKPVLKKKKKKIEEILEEEDDEEEVSEDEEDSEDEEYDEEEEVSEEVETEEIVPNKNIKVHRGKEDYVSETFENLVKDIETKEELKDTSPKSVLENIKVDLNSIEIINDLGVLEMNNLEDAILNDKTTMMVTCCQSSYTAELSALKSQEIQSISNSDVDYYSYKKKLYQTIHKHIETTSVGKMSYGKWLNVTSFFDIDTLLYGIYCQTFAYDNKYAITCPSCGKSFDAVVNNNTLIEIRGEEEGAELYKKINEIISSVNNAEELIEKSQVHKTKRICLEESKIIVDISIPSAQEYLEDVVRSSSQESLEDYSNAIGLSLFINEIYLPNVLLYKQTGELKFVKLNANKPKMIKVVSELSYADSIQLTNEINNFVDRYRVHYSIQNVICPHCGGKISNIPLDMEELLFFTINRMAQTRR